MCHLSKEQSLELALSLVGYTNEETAALPVDHGNVALLSNGVAGF